MNKKKKSTEVDYEELGATYQVVEIALLNSILKAHGIDKRKRRKICEDFIFDQGVIIDQGAFQEKPGGKWYAPVPCFAEAEGSPDEGFGRTQKFYKLSEDFPGYHEYAFGSLDYFFDECKEQTPFDWGPEHE
jgi:hypothetical protein